MSGVALKSPPTTTGASEGSVAKKPGSRAMSWRHCLESGTGPSKALDSCRRTSSRQIRMGRCPADPVGPLPGMSGRLGGRLAWPRLGLYSGAVPKSLGSDSETPLVSRGGRPFPSLPVLADPRRFGKAALIPLPTTVELGTLTGSHDLEPDRGVDAVVCEPGFACPEEDPPGTQGDQERTANYVRMGGHGPEYARPGG